MNDPSLMIGIDVGKRHDPTAISIAMAELRDDGRTHYVIPYLKRLPLDMPYPEQATELIRICTNAFDTYAAKLRRFDAYRSIPGGRL